MPGLPCDLGTIDSAGESGHSLVLRRADNGGLLIQVEPESGLVRSLDVVGATGCLRMGGYLFGNASDPPKQLLVSLQNANHPSEYCFDVCVSGSKWSAMLDPSLLDQCLEGCGKTRRFDLALATAAGNRFLLMVGNEILELFPFSLGPDSQVPYRLTVSRKRLINLELRPVPDYGRWPLVYRLKGVVADGSGAAPV